MNCPRCNSVMIRGLDEPECMICGYAGEVRPATPEDKPFNERVMLPVYGRRIDETAR